jgi:sugar lactone lactonase YvrE
MVWNLTQVGSHEVPSYLSVGPRGDLYSVDQNNGLIKIYTSSGTLVTQWGAEPNPPGKFAGEMDPRTHQVKILNASLQVLATYNQDEILNSPSDVAVDDAGRVYVADDITQQLRIYSSAGKLLTVWSSDGTADGQFKDIGAVALDDAGNLYVVDIYHRRIKKFSSEGKFLCAWGSSGSGQGQVGSVVGLAIDREGKVYVNDVQNHCIQIFTGSGQYLTQWPVQGFLSGIALDNHDRLYATNGPDVDVYASTGKCVARWSVPVGEKGTNLKSIAVDRRLGRVYVGDACSNRVLAYDTLP